MRLAGRILGGLVVAMLIVVIVLTFVSAAGILEKIVVNADGGGSDAVDLAEGGISFLLALLGYAGYILMNFGGAVLILYFICFAVSYAKLFRGKSNLLFIKYSAMSCCFIYMFEVILFGIRPSAGWKPFVVMTILTALMVAYAAVALKYLNNATEYDPEEKNDYAEPPSLRFDEDNDI